MSLRTGPLIGMTQSIDDASKPYDGPMAFEKPISCKEYLATQAERRRRIDELYEKRAQQRSDVIDWDVIESFLGYGNINAPVVFVGMEEGLADPERLQDDLKYRSTFEPVMDVYEAHLGLAKGKKLFGERPRGQRTWRVMADVMLHFEGGLPPTKEERAKARKEYRAKILGNKCAESLLLELLPYPHGNIKQWLYERFGRYKTREEYEAKLTDKRLELLRKVIEYHDREAIICYGHKNWDEFKKIFPEETRWDRNGDFLCAEWKGARVTLCDHFVSRGFNSNRQLDKLAAVALPPRRHE